MTAPTRRPGSRQRSAFVRGEGDAYFERNHGPEGRAPEPAGDLVLQALAALGPQEAERLRDAEILEIGASDGWRLDVLRRRGTGRRHVALDPSAEALRQGRRRFPELGFARGTADALPFRSDRFDAVIVGFCLYLVDRGDLFRVAAEVDRVLAPGGLLAILDFSPLAPSRTPYAHAEGLHSYKLDYPAMFLWNPAYRVAARREAIHAGGSPNHPEDRIAAAVLRHDPDQAYAETSPRNATTPIRPHAPRSGTRPREHSV